MVRVPLVPSDDPNAVRHGAFDTFAAEQTGPIDLHRALANVPELLVAHRSQPRHLRPAATRPAACGSSPSSGVAQLVGSACEWSHHRPVAEAAGVTEAQIDVPASWRSSDRFYASDLVGREPVGA